MTGSKRSHRFQRVSISVGTIWGLLGDLIIRQVDDVIIVRSQSAGLFLDLCSGVLGHRLRNLALDCPALALGLAQPTLRVRESHAEHQTRKKEPLVTCSVSQSSSSSDKSMTPRSRGGGSTLERLAGGERGSEPLRFSARLVGCDEVLAAGSG